MLSGSTRRARRAEARLVEGEERDASLALQSPRILLFVMLVTQHEPRVSDDHRVPDGGFSRGWYEGKETVVVVPLRELYAG